MAPLAGASTPRSRLAPPSARAQAPSARPRAQPRPRLPPPPPLPPQAALPPTLLIPQLIHLARLQALFSGRHGGLGWVARGHWRGARLGSCEHTRLLAGSRTRVCSWGAAAGAIGCGRLNPAQMGGRVTASRRAGGRLRHRRRHSSRQAERAGAAAPAAPFPHPPAHSCSTIRRPLSPCHPAKARSTTTRSRPRQHRSSGRSHESGTV